MHIYVIFKICQHVSKIIHLRGDLRSLFFFCLNVPILKYTSKMKAKESQTWGRKELADLKAAVRFVSRERLPKSFLGCMRTPLGAPSRSRFQDPVLEILTESS